MKRPIRNAAALLTIASAGMLASCAGIGSEGGALASYDQFTYVSTAWQPKTITLFDTRTGESLWSVDIPVGKQLMVGFRKGSGNNEAKPDEMFWEVTWAGRRLGTRDNRMSVPPASARRLEMTLRAAPEMPNAKLPGSPYTKSEPGKPGAGESNESTGTSGSTGDGPSSVVPPAAPIEPPKPPATPTPEPTPAPVPEPQPATTAPETPPAQDQPIDLPG